ncbi:hypothetical protein KCV03_g432, partial [Aureobasidium melanogenum]
LKRKGSNALRKLSSLAVQSTAPPQLMRRCFLVSPTSKEKPASQANRYGYLKARRASHLFSTRRSKIRDISTYGHSQLKTGHPVRSAIHKQLNGRLVLRWVTTWESLLL